MTLPPDSTMVARSPLLEGPKKEISPVDTAGLFVVSGLAWKVSAEWKSVPPANAMRAGEFHTSQGDTVTVFAFGQAGGDVPSNVERWKGQFAQIESFAQKPCASTPIPCQAVTIVGAYQGMAGSSGAPAKGARSLHGLIFQGPEGSVFVKAVVPASRAQQIERDYQDILASLRQL